jgi:hypothetical protein
MGRTTLPFGLNQPKEQPHLLQQLSCFYLLPFPRKKLGDLRTWMHHVCSMVLAKTCGRKIKDNLGFIPINTVTVGFNFHIWLFAHSWPTMKAYFYTTRQNMLLAFMVISQVLYSGCYISILFQHGVSFWINDGTQLQLCFHLWLQLENKTEFHLQIYALKITENNSRKSSEGQYLPHQGLQNRIHKKSVFSILHHEMCWNNLLPQSQQ